MQADGIIFAFGRRGLFQDRFPQLIFLSRALTWIDSLCG